MEAPPRFELGNRGFADLCLTTWLWRRIEDRTGFCPHFSGAEDEARTRYLHLGKVALYQMSYSRKSLPSGEEMVPPIGIEPMTRGFSVPCSTN